MYNRLKLTENDKYFKHIHVMFLTFIHFLNAHLVIVKNKSIILSAETAPLKILNLASLSR